MHQFLLTIIIELDGLLRCASGQHTKNCPSDFEQNWHEIDRKLACQIKCFQNPYVNCIPEGHLFALLFLLRQAILI